MIDRKPEVGEQIETKPAKGLDWEILGQVVLTEGNICYVKKEGQAARTVSFRDSFGKTSQVPDPLYPSDSTDSFIWKFHDGTFNQAMRIKN